MVGGGWVSGGGCGVGGVGSGTKLIVESWGGRRRKEQMLEDDGEERGGVERLKVDGVVRGGSVVGWGRGGSDNNLKWGGRERE